MLPSLLQLLLLQVMQPLLLMVNMHHWLIHLLVLLMLVWHVSCSCRVWQLRRGCWLLVRLLTSWQLMRARRPICLLHIMAMAVCTCSDICRCSSTLCCCCCVGCKQRRLHIFIICSRGSCNCKCAPRRRQHHRRLAALPLLLLMRLHAAVAHAQLAARELLL